MLHQLSEHGAAQSHWHLGTRAWGRGGGEPQGASCLGHASSRYSWGSLPSPPFRLIAAPTDTGPSCSRGPPHRPPLTTWAMGSRKGAVFCLWPLPLPAAWTMPGPLQVERVRKAGPCSPPRTEPIHPCLGATKKGQSGCRCQGRGTPHLLFFIPAKETRSWLKQGDIQFTRKHSSASAPASFPLTMAPISNFPAVSSGRHLSRKGLLLLFFDLFILDVPC